MDSSGLRFWYTDQARVYDTGVIYAGWEVTYHMMIPPEQKQWKATGYCVGACTKKVSFTEQCGNFSVPFTIKEAISPIIII